MVMKIWIFLILIGVLLYYYQKKNEKTKYNKLKNDLVNKYGKDFGLSILAGEVSIGMTYDMLIDAWGKPAKTGEKVIKENSSTITYYYDSYKTSRGNTHFKKIVILKNQKVSEIRIN